MSRVLFWTVALVVAALPAAAQAPAPSLPVNSSRPFEIEDNSFFVEEAFNQEAGVVQTIFGGAFLGDTGWAATITQEWPAPAMRHQLSFTMPFGRVNGETGPGDVALNYRYQLLEEKPGQPAIAPRFTLLMPTGSKSRGLGAGAWGLQLNVPVSKQLRDFYFHGNAGVTWYPSASFAGPSADATSATNDDPSRALTSPFVAGSTIYRVRPMLHLMIESVVSWQQALIAPGVADRAAFRVLSPGVRTGWNHGDTQYVVGAAVPTTWGPDHADLGVFVYASYETAFWHPRKP